VVTFDGGEQHNRVDFSPADVPEASTVDLGSVLFSRASHYDVLSD